MPGGLPQAGRDPGQEAALLTPAPGPLHGRSRPCDLRSAAVFEGNGQTFLSPGG
jgi:hypothetical protein